MTFHTSDLMLVGAGKMGAAMLEGWLAKGLAGHGTIIADPYPSEAIKALCAKHTMRLNPAPEGRTAPSVLVLAIKPQTLDDAAPALARLASPDTLVLSILAGKTLSDLRERMPNAGGLVRAMPNLPAAVSRGITAAVSAPGLSLAQRASTDALLGAVGAVEWLDDEGLIDAVTAVSGSGPAYVFLLAECMAQAGEAAGLPKDVALRLARATIEGAGELMHRAPDVSPTTLREQVTSPGGTTAAALAVLMADDALAPLMVRAIAAAKARAEALSG